MLRKNILLFAFLIINMTIAVASEQPKGLSWTDWFKSFFFTSTQNQKKFKTAVKQASARGKALDLQKFYAEKESSETFKDPKKSAEKFKLAIAQAIKNNNLMRRFITSHGKFLFGTSESSYQCEGGLDNNNANAVFYLSKGLPTAGNAIDFWNKYESDIKQMKKELGINSFRISIAWDRVQLAPEIWNDPNKTLWDERAIEKYVKIIKTLKKYDIEPVVVLHHYTIPQWFAEIDGFEKTDNIKYFVEFAKKMYAAFHEHVTYWSTFNAIEGYAFKGYWTYDGPPGIHSMQTTQTVMANMLNAHVQIYQSIKGPEGLYKSYAIEKNIPNPQIGIQKNIVLLDPHEQSNICIRTGTRPFCALGTAMQNKGFFDFFTTGRFKMYIPRWINVLHIDKRATDSIDWIGINEYSNMEMRWSAKQKATDRKTKNENYRDYPEGIYRAVKLVYEKLAKPLNIPIIITENGIATDNDTAGNEQRTRFFQRALYTIRKLVEEGYPIIGYTPWSSHDNYEWPSKEQPDPYDRPYGFFAVNFDKKSATYLKRTLKTGSEYYRDFITEYLKPSAKIANSKTWLE